MSVQAFMRKILTELIDSIPVGAASLNPGVKKLTKLNDHERDMAQLIYLGKDRLDLWQQLGSHAASTDALDWVRDNLEHALQHCPKLVAHWAHFSQYDGRPMVEKVAVFIDKNPGVTDEDRLAILRGQPCAKFPALGDNFRFALSQEEDCFVVLSPAWIGAEHSELREEAIGCGWIPHMLPRMSRHADKDSAKHWIERWPFAYTLMLLDFKVRGILIEELRDERSRAREWDVPVQALAQPRDLVVARAVLPYLDASKRDYAFHLPAGMAKPEVMLPPEEVAQLTHLVNVYMGLGMEQTLLTHFTRQSLMAVPDGKMLDIEAGEGLELPELGSP